MVRRDLKTLVCLGAILLVLVGCGGGGATPTPIIIVVTPPPPTQPESVTVVVTPPPPEDTATAEVVQPPPPEAGIEVQEATFAHGLTEEMQPVDPGADFSPDETVYLSLRIRGRPEEGVVTARFYWYDSLIAEAGVDLADVNSGLVFSLGEDTYAGYTLTHEEPFPISDRYRTEVFYNDQFLDTYAFRVVPPPEAIPSQVTQATLALGADEEYNPIEPTTTFAVDEAVYLVGEGDLGVDTWLQADWYVKGELDEGGTRSITLEENIPNAGFAFSFLPDGGWPPGEHFVVLTMNDEEAGRYPFTVLLAGN